MYRFGSVFLLTAFAASAAGDSDGLEYFEKQVRPLFAQYCYTCHSTKVKTPFAGLRLDTADIGKVVVAGKPADSKLIKAVKGETAMRMPPTGSLKAEQVAVLERWVTMGAAWPKEMAAASAPASAGFDLEARRREHWAWHPVKRAAPPTVRDAAWPLQPVDFFVLAGLESKGLQPARPTDKLTLLRRVYFDVTGSPATPAQIAAFENDTSANAYETLVDRLLDSPQYGERMARRWMDVIRYSESHGSEGDPDIPQAWRYRDYLIRAFNADVPYGQLIREHLAGDLLASPRINAQEKLNESAIGAAHLRMVEHGFQPVDPWEDRVKWTDNQVDVFSKAFQGLTVSCARCHDHKFDAISQKDFYALFGIFAAARPTQVAIDSPAELNRNRDELIRLKAEIKKDAAARWRRDAKELVLDPLKTEDVACDPESPLYPVLKLKNTKAIADWQRDSGRDLETRREFNRQNFKLAWDATRADYDLFPRQGVGAPAKPSPPGEFAVEPSGERAVTAIYPAGVYSGLVSRKHAAVVATPRFKLESDALSFRLMGGNYGSAVLIVENYPVPRGGIYNLRSTAKSDRMGWVRWDVSFWKGFSAYIEFATMDDLALLAGDEDDGRLKRKPVRDGHSWFGIGQIVTHGLGSADKPLKPREELLPVNAVLDCPAEAFRDCLSARLAASLDAWEAGRLSDDQSALLDYFVRKGIFESPVTSLVARYRELEGEITVSRRAPGVLEEAGGDAALLVRGNHKAPGELVPRRYLTALDSKPFEDPAHVRLRLAGEVASASNPLTARVMVNRLWKIAFRRGIVRTVDNFGKLGERPTHPELLDWLAANFVDNGWSVRKTMRMLLTSRAYRMASEANPADVANDLFSFQPVRRLEAEEIRDAILAVSGHLDAKMFGEPVPVFYSHDMGKTKGDREKGPLDGNGRRSVYLEVRRNATNPFLEVFDVYKPTSTRGVRDVTNVPGQSLALMNSPFVIEEAGKWAKRSESVDTMYLEALGRRPTAVERDKASTFIAETSLESFAQALFNLKEFLYVR